MNDKIECIDFCFLLYMLKSTFMICIHANMFKNSIKCLSYNVILYLIG